MGCGQSSTFETEVDEELEYELNNAGRPQRGAEKPEEGFDFFEKENAEKEQFMATKAWKGAMKEPTEAPNFDPSPPEKKLKLSFVNGFTVEGSRQNMFWTKNDNEIIYPAAALGVKMNTQSLQQEYLGDGEKKSTDGHVDDVVALGICPERKLVVTGSIGSRPMILVWDSQTMQIKSRTKLGRNTRGVSTIRFTRDGKQFYVGDKHNDSNIYLYDTESCSPIGENKCGSDPIFDGEAGDDGIFGVATKRGIMFFQMKDGQLDNSKGLFGDNSRQSMITITYNPDESQFYTGSTAGTVYSWGKDRNCTSVQKMHEGTIMALTYSNGRLLTSGSKDNLVKVHNTKERETINSITVPSYAKSLDFHHQKILAACKEGQVLVMPADGASKQKIMHGHWTGETWGLAIGADGLVYTTGDDNSILAFNPAKNKVEKKGIINTERGKKYKIGGASTLSLLPPNQQSRAIAISKQGHIAIGLNDGTLSIRKTEDLNSKVVEDKRISKQWIEVLKYSPDEKKLAVGSHDNSIYIFDVPTYNQIAVCSKHNSFITSFDWSQDGNHIHSNCGAYEYLFFDANTGEQLTDGATTLRDEIWSTYTLKIGWWVQGIFPRGTSGDHVNGICRNNAKDVIATGDDWGFVNLYRNPALSKAQCTSYRAHSSHVVRVLFDQTDSTLYSIGGYDKTLMIWKVL